MKANFTNLRAKAWVLLAIPAMLLGYPLVRCVLPAVVHAVIPEAVRQVLSAR